VSQSTRQLDELAELLDSQFRGPFGLRFGLDGLIGLIPGVGDIITTLMASIIIFKSAANGVSVWVLCRMLFNLWIDNLLSAIPIMGIFIDFFYKANNRNLRLLKNYEANHKLTDRNSALMLIGICLIILLSIVGFLALSIWLSIWVFSELFNFLHSAF